MAKDKKTHRRRSPRKILLRTTVAFPLYRGTIRSGGGGPQTSREAQA